MANCAKKYFYKGKSAAESEVMTTEDKFKKMHLLALLEACFICGDGNVPSEISVEVTYRLKRKYKYPNTQPKWKTHNHKLSQINKGKIQKSPNQ
jgi:hypothetical protein